MKKVIALIGAAAFIALIYYCVSYMRSPVSTLSAYTVTHEESLSCDAYIVRSETVYTSPSDGTFYSYAREGARVGRNRRLCAVYSGSVDTEILKEIGTLDAKITEISTTVVNEEDFTSDRGSTENRIIVIEKNIDEAAAQNDVAKIASYKAELKSIAAGETLKSSSETLEELNARKSTLEGTLTSPKEEIISTESGIYSTAVDGFERILTPEAAKGITVSDFLKLKPEAKQPTPSPVPDKKDGESMPDVYAGNEICKVIDNHEWYIMALVNKEDVKELSTGSTVNVRFGKLPGEETKAEIISFSNESPEQERTVAILRCESYSEGVFSIRSSDIEIIKESYTGFQVPISAVRVEDGHNGVMVRSGGREVFKPCNVIYMNDDEGVAIITPNTSDTSKILTQYDMIILGEK